VVDVRKDFVNIISDELGACPSRERVLSISSLEHGWQHGIPVADQQMRQIADDHSWWFIAAFAPEEYPFAVKVFNAVPGFFFDLARLGEKMGQGPSEIDFNLIYYLRRRLLQELWPTAYQVATSVTKGPAAGASALIRKFHTAEQWQKKY